jgi:hypothetical protein
MAGQKISELSNMPSGDINNADEFVIVDSSESSNKAVTWGQLVDAMVERGSNANGEYVRFADGTQICTHKQTSSSSSDSTWTYPAAFAPGKTDCLQISPTSMTGVNVPAIAPSTAGSAIFTVRDALNSGARVAVDVWLIAVGRWF